MGTVEYHRREAEAAAFSARRYLGEMEAATGDLRAALWTAVKAAARGVEAHLEAAYQPKVADRAERQASAADQAYFRTLGVRSGLPADPGDAPPMDWEIPILRQEVEGWLRQFDRVR